MKNFISINGKKTELSESQLKDLGIIVDSKPKWKDFGQINGFCVSSISSDIIKMKENFSSNANIFVFPTEEEAKACLALSQLCQWRDKYNIGWKPNWEKDYKKYSLMYMKGFIIGSESPWVQSVLAFKSASIRDKFLEDFAELIKEASPLL